MECEFCGNSVENFYVCSSCGLVFCNDCGDKEKELCRECETELFKE